MKKIVLTTWILTSLFSLSVWANEQPRSMATDNRIKVVAYNTDDVVTIRGSHLVATGIQFAPDETILSVVNGDPVAWTTAVNKSIPYMLYIKPILPDSSTNMTVITNQHNYQFHLMTASGDSANSKNVTYLLSFKYPDEEKSQLQSQLQSLQKTFMGNMPGDPVTWNYNYSFYGSHKIAPVQAVDNGTFTVFKFPKNTPVPAIFAVDSHENEAMVNFRVQGDYVFVQGTKRLYTLRNGQDVTSVYNDSYSTR